MNGQDRKDIDGLKTDVNDLYACYNDLGESVDEIKTNHLPHLNMKVNFVLGGLAFIGVMIAILGCMIAFAK